MTRADECVIACAEAFRGDGEIVASAFGWIPTIGARLAKATFEPDLLVSDGEAMAVANPLPLGSTDKVVEGWLPFRHFFDLVWSGRRHVMMGASQIDRHGNQNISCIGDWAKPKAQLIGVRGGPGNSVSHPTSYWVPNHSPRVFVPDVDFVSGVGHGRGVATYVRFVVTNLCVLDFRSGTPAIASLHGGVTVDHVRAQTGFELAAAEPVAHTREPTDDEIALIAHLDPHGLRMKEVP
jgi:acyl CoA:acetate/3-ketoacid CoA transferase beta subunit